jgi:hypothetical protein
MLPNSHLLVVIDRLTLQADLLNCLLDVNTKTVNDFKRVYKLHGIATKNTTLTDAANYLGLPNITAKVIGDILQRRRQGGIV